MHGFDMRKAENDRELPLVMAMEAHRTVATCYHLTTMLLGHRSRGTLVLLEDIEAVGMWRALDDYDCAHESPP
jgi:hypothetical protein